MRNIVCGGILVRLVLGHGVLKVLEGIVIIAGIILLLVVTLVYRLEAEEREEREERRKKRAKAIRERPPIIRLPTFMRAPVIEIIDEEEEDEFVQAYEVVREETLPCRANAKCSICLEAMRGSEPRRALTCGHEFHVHCVSSWFRREQTCPMCRVDQLN
jgi:hypothetical protein